MNPTESKTAPGANDSPFPEGIATAFRGGAIMIAGSVVGGLLLQPRNNPIANLWLNWLPVVWLVFPLGAMLGRFLPRWVASRGLVSAIGLGVCVGMSSGLAVAGGFLLCGTHRDLIGLVVNRGSGGYASYSYSVGLQLREEAWRALIGVAPVMAVWVTVWTMGSRSARKVLRPEPTHERLIRLRVDRHLFKLVGWVAVGLALVAITALLATSLMARSVHTAPASFLIAGIVAAGLVVLGPWLGPLINPGGGTIEAWHYTAVALPVLLGGLAPFALCRHPVRQTTAVVAWCGLVTALLFWTAAGALSLGYSLG